MFLIVGYIIILGASLGTSRRIGSLAALWVPMEYIAIVGLTVGGFVAATTSRSSRQQSARCPACSKGRNTTRRFTSICWPCCSKVLAKVRKEG